MARVLGNDLLRQIRSSDRDSGRGRGVDIEILLQSAEKLCTAHEVPGAIDRIAALRQRHRHISTSIQTYEGQISKQQVSMSRFNTAGSEEQTRSNANESTPLFNEQDLAAEDNAIKELEAKKRALEARVAGMERDLGGLMR